MLPDSADQGKTPAPDAPPRHHEGATPVPWRVSFPAHWAVEPGGSTENVGSLQASSTTAGGELAGTVAFGIVGRSSLRRPREVASLFLEMLTAYGLTPDGGDFVEEEAPKRFEKSWLLATGIQRERSLPGALRCRVLRHEHAWVVLGLVGPREQDEPEAFADNLRAFELATTSLRIRG